MAASAASSLLPSQLLRYLSSRLGALYRSAPSASLQQPREPAAVAHSEEVEAARGDKMAAAPTSVPRGVDVAAAAGQLMVARRGGAPPKGRPGKPKEGGGGKVNAVPTSARVAKRGRRTPTPPGSPAEGAGGRGGKIHAAAASASS